MNIGLVLNHLGRYGESLEAGRFAAQEYRELGARERLATVQMNLGLLHVNRGEFGEAIQGAVASRALCEELGLEAKRAAVDLDLTRTYQALSLVTEAAEACGRAIATFRSSTSRSSRRRRCCSRGRSPSGAAIPARPGAIWPSAGAVRAGR